MDSTQTASVQGGNGGQGEFVSSPQVTTPSDKFDGNLLKYLGPSYGGRVYELDTEKYSEFYDLNKRQFTPSGITTYLRAGRIPYPYFKRHHDTAYTTILSLECGWFKAEKVKSLFLLERDDKVEFVAINRGQPWQDPSRLINPQMKAEYKLLKEDLGRGVYSIYRRTDANSPHFEPTAFLELPIFLTNPFTVSVGLFRIACTNALRAKAIKSAGKIRFDATIDSKFMDAMFVAISERLDEKYKELEQLRNALVETSLTPSDCLPVFEHMAEVRSIPKPVMKEAVKHVQAIIDGQSPPEFTKVENYHDAVNILTGKVRELSLFPRANSESGIFNYMNNRLGLPYQN